MWRLLIKIEIFNFPIYNEIIIRKYIKKDSKHTETPI